MAACSAVAVSGLTGGVMAVSSVPVAFTPTICAVKGWPPARNSTTSGLAKPRPRIVTCWPPVDGPRVGVMEYSARVCGSVGW